MGPARPSTRPSSGWASWAPGGREPRSRPRCAERATRSSRRPQYPTPPSGGSGGTCPAPPRGAANHLVTLVGQAAALLREAGVGQPERMLGPLLSAALDNALRLGDAALTGPVARGDADPVASHIEALRAAAPQALPAYLALARLTADRALAAGTLSAPDAQRLLGVLGGAPR